MNNQRFARLGRGGSVLFALTLAGQAASGGAVGEVYFSIEGDINASGDQYDFTFDLTRSVSSAETLFFETHTDEGGTNQAGDVIPSFNFDSDLRLFDGLNTEIAQSDEINGGINDYDALLSWAGVQTDPDGTPMPDPLGVDSYRLNLQEYGDTGTGPFAVDLVGPADALVFTGGTPVAGGTVRSLKFGTDIGIAAAVYNHSTGTFTLQDQLVVAQTGGGILNLSGGTITVGGLTTINAQGSLNQTNGTFNANGGLTIDGGIYTRTNGTFNLAAGQTLTVLNGGLFEWGSDDLYLNIAGSAVQVSGAGSVLRNTTAGDNSVRVQNGVSVDVELGGALEASYLLINQGSVTIDGSGSTLDLSSASTPGFIHSLGTTSGTTGSLTLSNNATGTYVGSSPSRLLVGRSGGTGILDVLSGADLTLEELDMDETGTSTVTVDGSGSTITQTAGSALTVGSASGTTGTLNVQNSGVFNASNTGAININATGSLNINSTGVITAPVPNKADGSGLIGDSGATLTTSGAISATDGTLQLHGGRGANGNLFGNKEGQKGGDGGNLIMNGGTINIMGSGSVSLHGGTGGQEDLFGSGPAGMGGNGGTADFNAGTLTLSDTSVFTVAGGNGAWNNANSDGRPGGTGGTGGTINVAGASVQINTGSALAASGGNGGGAWSPTKGARGGDGGLVNVSAGSLDIDGGTLNLRGTNGGSPGTAAGGNGGNAGSLNVNGGALRLNTGLIDIRGGDGGNGGGTGNGGNGGNGGTLSVLGGTMTLNDGLITTAGGARGAKGVFGSNGVAGSPGLIDITGGTFDMNGGEVFTGTFQRSGAGIFNHNDGKLTVSGGTFDPGTANHTINGSVAAQLPTLVMTDGALATGLTGSMIVGQGNRGRLEVINSNSSVQAGNYFVLGQSFGSEGTLEVHAGGMVGSSNRFVVGDGGTGTANIGAGGQLVASNDLDLGAIGTGTLNADGSGALVTVASNLYAGGWIGGDGGTGELNINNDATVDVANTLRVFDGGTVNFAGGMLTADTIDHTHGGAFNFTGGTLHVVTFNGTLDQNGGTLAPGSSPGKTVISSDYNQNSGVLEIELSGTVQTSEYDFVEVLGLASLNGDLVVSAINGFNPTYGDSFDLLMAWGGLIDAFNSVSFPANPANSAWSLTNDGNFLRLSLDSTLAGDLDNDGFVGISDLNIVLGNWNLSVTPGELLLGDPSGDGFVGIEDLNQVLGNWNAGTPPGDASTQVPEPATGALLILGALALGRRGARAR